MLSISGASWLPDAFDLSDNFSGVTHKAKVVWRRPGRVGVHFTDVPDYLPRQKRAEFGKR